MKPAIHVVTLGVKDIAKARRFYEVGLGLKASLASNEHFIVFHMNGMALCLYPERSIAEDAMQSFVEPGFRGVSLAHNVSSKSEVKQVLDCAASAGAKIVKQAQDVFWGGHSGYFADLDGHFWEVAWNPHWLLQADGKLVLPD